METFAVAISSMSLDGKLVDGDDRWGRLNASFVNRWVDPMELGNCIVQGRAYTSWHDPMYRHSDNWQLSQFLAVDMDTGDERSGIRNLANQDFVMGFAAMIHTTPSHTESKPRARVIFLLDRPIVNAGAYSTAAKFLSKILGGDKVATDPSRFYYGNKQATVEMVRGKLPVDYLYTLYRRDKDRQETSDTSHRHHSSATHSKNQGKNQSPTRGRYDDVKRLLERIDPMALEYLDWVAAIAAIKHELGDQGISLAISWARGKPGEIERMWKSLRREQGGNLATFGTLAHFAYPAG